MRKNQSEKLIVRQDIVEAENRINFLANRFPEPIERASTDFFDLTIHAISVGVPSQLLQNRADIRQAERELEAAGLDIYVARTRFYPALTISAGVGYEAFSLKYLFNSPQALAYNLAGNLVAPLINKKAIQADYLTANARQLQSLYDYQRTVLQAFTEVINRISMAENYRKSVEIRKQQLTALELSVDAATNLFQNARAEYVEVLLAQRDLQDARLDLIDTKRQQLSAVVNAYQALGGGNSVAAPLGVIPIYQPIVGMTKDHTVRGPVRRSMDALRSYVDRMRGHPQEEVQTPLEVLAPPEEVAPIEKLPQPEMVVAPEKLAPPKK